MSDTPASDSPEQNDNPEEFFDRLASGNELDFKEIVETLLQCGKSDFKIEEGSPKTLVFTKACPNLIYRPSDNPQAEYDVFCLDCSLVIHTSLNIGEKIAEPTTEAAGDEDDEFFSQIGSD